MSVPISFEDSVKAKLKTIVAELIPEDRYNQIVERAVLEFTNNDLPKLVKEELTTQYRKAIVAELSKPEWQGKWNNTGLEASPALQELILKMAPHILTNMIGGQLEFAISAIRSNIASTRY